MRFSFRHKLLERILSSPGWKTKDEKIRLETLLWGGDEIIWVVPAWQGWWMVKEFYTLAESFIKFDGNTLFHACGLVFCHHNAPIHRIDALARSLADIAKAKCKEKNFIAYQVLESFDHAGMQLDEYRQQRLGNLGQPDHLLVDAGDMNDIKESFRDLKADQEFAKRKIYQIVDAYKIGNTVEAQKHEGKLEKKIAPESQNHLKTLKETFKNEQAYWLHLMDLWDYIGNPQE